MRQKDSNSGGQVFFFGKRRRALFMKKIRIPAGFFFGGRKFGKKMQVMS
tara:strand:- start:221 stop:367 length:147 start_codon:yes stop_codon:yes gene_type:complete